MGRHAHHRAGRPLASRRGVLAVSAAVVLLAALVAPSVTQRFSFGCQRAMTLRVAADPSIAPVVADLGTRLRQSTRRVDGRCVDVAVRAVDAASVLAAVSGGTDLPGRPHVWVPDSSAWLSLARTSPSGAALMPPKAPSVASSPMVIAMPRQAAVAAGWPDAPLGWGSVLGAGAPGTGQVVSGGRPQARLGLADPTRSAAGLVGLITLERAAASAAPAWTRLTSAEFLMGLRRVAAVDADPTALLRAGVGALPVFEQQVWRVNADMPATGVRGAAVDAGATPLVAVYPPEGAPAADYPYAVLHAPWADGRTRAAARHLRDEMTGAPAAALLSRNGLRDPSGRAGRFATAAAGLGAGTPKTLPTPDGQALTQALTVWEVAGRHGRVLAAVDVSGSMALDVPGTGRTRMGVARSAGAEVVRLFDERSELGVWVFATRLDGARDHRQVLPVGPLGQRVGDRTRLELVTGALSRLSPVPGRGTGLYDTALAAFRQANASYKPGVLNVVVLLTDGVNDDPRGITRGRLLAEVAREFDPERPVVFFTFGYGSRSDASVLAELATLTGGRFYLTRDPASIRAAFVDALLDSAELSPRSS